MLFDKSGQPLTRESFERPGPEYRAVPFWAWNGKIEKAELLRQIDVFKEMGFGGFHIHVRTGLETPYLSDEYMELVRLCVDRAKALSMKVWLYDEDRWPSGSAGGKVTKNPAFRQMTLTLTRRKPEETPTRVFDVELDAKGMLKAYRPLPADETPRGFRLYAFLRRAGDNPWFNGQSYVDTLDPEAIRAFLDTTHERYAQALSGEFGNAIPAIFTDEPQFAAKGALPFSDSEADVSLPWTDELESLYREAWGESILDHLPALLWEGEESPRIRWQWHDLVAERFASSYADQLGSWCGVHGLYLTGHMMQEPTLFSQTRSLGEAMRSYRAFQLPGVDMLRDHREYTTVKQAASAAHQYGREGVLSELYGVVNYDFDFRKMKLQGDWQAALGISVRVPHLSWYTMWGEAKRDYPPTFQYQSPWAGEWKTIEDHFARVHTGMTRGKPMVRIGVIHPIESYWMHWGAAEQTHEARREMDDRFLKLTNWLLRGQMDFDFICESLLPEQMELSHICSPRFPVGEMAYDAVVVPPVETLRKTTVDRLFRFRACGGRVLFLGEAPQRMDARSSGEPAELYQQCERCDFSRLSLLSALEDLREIDIRNEDGARTDDLLCGLRQEGEDRWLFLAQADADENPDIPEARKLRVRVRGAWYAALYDTLRGSVTALPATKRADWTELELEAFKHTSFLLHLTKGTDPLAAESKAIRRYLEWEKVDLPLEPVPVTLSEPNVLVLDRAEYALDGEVYQPAEDILRLDNKLRRMLGWPERGNNIIQPYVSGNIPPSHVLHLRYTWDCGVDGMETSLAIEQPEDTKITCNGQPVERITGWWTDRCLKKLRLPPLKAGGNTLEIEMPYGPSAQPEAVYLLGDFAVSVAGPRERMDAFPGCLSFGSIAAQGLPFYGGNITYHIPIALPKGEWRLDATCWRGMALSCALDGEAPRSLSFAPYQFRFHSGEEGKHVLHVKLFGTRVNTFGQLHCCNPKESWWGPDSFRTRGVEWSDEYVLRPQGVLKAPVLYRLSDTGA